MDLSMIQAELRRTFDSITSELDPRRIFSELPELIDDIDKWVVANMPGLIGGAMQTLVSRSGESFQQLNELAPGAFAVRGVPFRVFSSLNALDPRGLDVSIWRNDGTPSHQIDVPINLTGTAFGRFAKVRLEADTALTPYHADLGAWLEAIISQAANWQYSLLMRSLAEWQTEFAIQVYGVLRSLLVPEISRDVFLLIVVRERGQYILDPVARERVWDRIVQNARADALDSPLTLTSKFETHTRPLETLVAKDIVPQDSVAEVDLGTAPFARTGINPSNRAVFATDSIVVQALVGDADLWLEAIYPPTLRGVVETQLEAAKPSFRRAVHTYQKDMRKTIDAFARRTTHSGLREDLPTVLGEFWGALLREILNL